MNNIAHRGARPVAVKFAFILLALNTSLGFTMSLIYIPRGNLFLEVSSIGFLIIYVIPLWFLFLGKNWARWLVVILTFCGICHSFFFWVWHHQTFSVFETVWFWLVNLSDIITVIALFHPSSNRWFQAKLLTK
jgi:hypothetical protein